MSELHFNREEINLMSKDDKIFEVFETEKIPTKKNQEQRPRLIDPSKLKPRKTSWLWKNKLALKRLNLVTGLKGRGKTFWTCYLASVITNGFDWPDGEPCERGSVLFFAGEDTIDEDYIPRLEANNADLTKVRFIDGDGFALTIKDLADIENTIKDTSEETGIPVRLVIIDPVSNFWGGISENNNSAVRSVLKPLAQLAERCEVAFLLIQHMGKSPKKHAQHKILGSTGLPDICRTVWGLYLNESTKQRFFAHINSNCCVDPTAVEFVINREAGGRVEIIDGFLEKTGSEIEAELLAVSSHKIDAGDDEQLTAEQWEILKKIEQHGGEATVQKLKDCLRKYHTKGGTESLERELRRMVKKDILTTRNEKAGNGRAVDFFAIPTVPVPTMPIFPGKNCYSGNRNRSKTTFLDPDSVVWN